MIEDDIGYEVLTCTREFLQAGGLSLLSNEFLFSDSIHKGMAERGMVPGINLFTPAVASACLLREHQPIH